MPVKLILAIFFFLSVITPTLLSQESRGNCPQEDSLIILRNLISESPSDSLRLHYNTRFSDVLKECLLSPNAQSYNFDSLTFLSVLTDKRQAVRLITWQLENAGKSYSYFGLIQYRSGTAITVCSLYDTLFSRVPDENAVYDKSTWYGGVYYDMKVVENADSVVLTILGRRNLSDGVSCKFIEFINLSREGRLQFGNRNMLVMKDKRPVARVFFDYPAEIPLTLRFEDTRYVKGKPKKQSLIVFHRLTKQPLFDRYNMPVPDYETYDGFLLDKGKWHFLSDIDLRTNSSSLPVKKKRAIKPVLFDPESNSPGN